MDIKQTYEKKKLEVSIQRAEVNKQDYELKILEKQMDIERLQYEIGKQDEVIEKAKEELKNFV